MHYIIDFQNPIQQPFDFPLLFALKPIKASIFISQCCIYPCIEVPHQGTKRASAKPWAHPVICEAHRGHQQKTQNNRKVLLCFFHLHVRYAVTFLTSPIVTDTPALAHLLGLLPALLENGANEQVQRSRYLASSSYSTSISNTVSPFCKYQLTRICEESKKNKQKQ